jgi:hypothetical protein
MYDPMGQVITDLRAVSIASGRVRGGEPAAGDALQPGSYQRFVVLVRLGRTRFGRTAAQLVRIGYRAYGATFQDAAALAGQIADALDFKGGRGSGGNWIYQSLEETGGEPEKDPDTGQPYETGVISLIASI